ncbi:MAG TPA: DUF364 domain-containing protein [Anaerolineaceae bacterium]|nr:DUF364 domain-containing protein [Anaerolineaceae bacterium]
MNLYDDLLNSITIDAPVETVLVGAFWTAVCSRGCGLAATYKSPRENGRSAVRRVGHLTGSSARQLAEYIRSDNLLEASIGLAALNSLLEQSLPGETELNAFEILAGAAPDQPVALVGHFPFVDRLRTRVKQLWVLEQDPLEGDYPAEAAPDLLPRAALIGITASTLINHTLENLLTLCPAGARVLILGPSTPLSPILFGHGATILAGTRVLDAALALRCISEGASFREVQGVRLVTLTNSTKDMTA